ncbi:NAD(P)-dependent oxidoreductase [Nocardioides sp. SR21]|uniref:NAD-dependent epimerase/dehydratase family protein n=1 Tax=Nocardioides sp. SR21 TaxID=2919501 RepID=UPI001FAB2F2A|nr:NAD-dependent epimerase/dehydratase family protein [Nocardioides sp. SR21]
MRVLVIGAGLVGTEVGARLKALGHEVAGTTTTPGKVDGLREHFDEVYVLRGSDKEAVAAAVAGHDAVVVAAGPNAQKAMTPEDRAVSYKEILVDTAESVVAADGAPYLVALSSLSVYGDAADHLAEVVEDGPVTDSTDASPTMFLAMERTYLAPPESGGAGDRAVVFRCGDIFGAGDPPIEAKVGMAHQYLGGSVPFSGDALFYRLAVEDAADAIVHALETRITGLHNLTHAEVPPTNAALFDAISAAQGLPALVYRDEIASPKSPISVAKLSATGFTASRSYDAATLEAGIS